MGRQPLLIGFVRIITGTNDVLRVTNNDVAQDMVLTAGVYPLGLSARAADEDTWWTGTTLFKHLRDRSAAIGTAWSFALEYAGSPVAPFTTPRALGAIQAVTGVSGTTEQIHWDHVNTTFPRALLGIGPEATTSTIAFAIYAPIGQFSSTLAYVGERAPRLDELQDRPFEAGLRADDGSMQRFYYGRLRSRHLEFKLSGNPRLGRISGYHDLRRFLDQINRGRADGRLLYFPDGDQTSYVAFDADGNTEILRYGFEDMTVNEQRGFPDWDDAEVFPGYSQLWRKRLILDEHEALT